MKLRHLRCARLPAQIRSHKYGTSGFIHAEVDCAISQVNVGVAHASVFPVEEVKLISALEKIRRKQVVVAWSWNFLAAPHRANNFSWEFQSLAEFIRMGDIEAFGGSDVVVDHWREIKYAWNLWRASEVMNLQLRCSWQFPRWQSFSVHWKINKNWNLTIKLKIRI